MIIELSEGVVSQVPFVGADGQPVFYWDSKTPSLGLRVSQGSKSYVASVQFRRRTVRLTLGRAGVLTLKDARKRALEAAVKANAGIDPRADKQASLATPTLATIYGLWIEQHVGAKRKPKTKREYEKLWLTHIEPKFGNRYVDHVTRSAVSNFHHGLRSTPYTANACIRLLRACWNWAVDHGHIASSIENPAQRIELFEEKAREAYLEHHEYALVAAAMTSLKAEGKVEIKSANCIELILRTGARSDEIKSLRRDYIDLDGGCLRLPDSKTGSKIITLDEHTLARVREMIADADDEEETRKGKLTKEGKPCTPSPFLFPNSNDAQRPMAELKRAWHNIVERAGIPYRRVHDLRHSYGSHGAALVGTALVGKQLGHRQSRTTDRYIHAVPVHQRAAVNVIGSSIDAALNASLLIEAKPSKAP